MMMKRILLLALSLVMITTHIQAQEDILNENDFLEPPEDIPMEDFGGDMMNTPPPPPPPTNFAPAPSGTVNPSFSGTKKRRAPPLSQATDADITNENYPDLIDSFDFPNADIADVIKAISELTGKNFIVDPNVSGKITIMAPTQVTVAEAYKVFLSALAIRGFSVVPSGKFLKILPVRDAQRDNLEIFSGAYTPDTDQMITRIIHLKYVPATDMNKFATKLVSKNGNIDIYEPTNSLIVSDQASSVQRLIKIVEQLDVAGFDEQMAVIKIKFAKAKDIAELIDQIINKGQNRRSGGGNFSSGIPRFRPGGQQQSSGGSAFSTVISDDRTNSVIVVGNKAGIDKIRKLVATLDFKDGAGVGGAFVYYVKHGEAKKIADIINGIAKQLQDEKKNQQGNVNANFPPPPPVFNDGFGMPMQQGQASGGAGLFGADVKISADEDTNSLIIVGSRQDYQAVLALLNKIDIARDQVYVEAIIMELNANDNTSVGLSYYKFVEGTDGLGRAGFGGGNFGTLTALGSEGAILGFASGDPVKVNIGGVEKTVKSLMGFLNLLKQNTKSDILATPQIIAMDNEQATVEVGSEVPIAVTAVPSGNGGATVPNVERVKATIKLEIKPFISPSSETVRMNIKQSIKQVETNPADGSDLAKISRTLGERAIETNIVMRDGDTAVLGGLIRDEQTEEVYKVPLLGDIPVLGWLFKSTKWTKKKQNLLVFITPKVIRNPEDSGRLISRKLDERVRDVKESFGGKDRHGAFSENLRPKMKVAPAVEESEDEFYEEEE